MLAQVRVRIGERMRSTRTVEQPLPKFLFPRKGQAGFLSEMIIKRRSAVYQLRSSLEVTSGMACWWVNGTYYLLVPRSTQDYLLIGYV